MNGCNGRGVTLSCGGKGVNEVGMLRPTLFTHCLSFHDLLRNGLSVGGLHLHDVDARRQTAEVGLVAQHHGSRGVDHGGRGYAHALDRELSVDHGNARTVEEGLVDGHEAWHVAQQMAGRVAPTTEINGMPVNDNAALEHEADVMGAKANSY